MHNISTIDPCQHGNIKIKPCTSKVANLSTIVSKISMGLGLAAFCVTISHAAPVIEQRSLSKPNNQSEQASQAWKMYETIQKLEAEVRQLRDKVEVLESGNIRYRDNLTKLTNSLEQRIGALEGGLVDVINNSDGNTGNSGEPLSDEEEAQAKKVYVDAYQIFKSEGVAAGVEAMDNFIKTYPSSQLIANAHYWIGEFYLSDPNPNYDLAALSFQTVINTYPDSAKAATALYRLATIADADGKTETARGYARRIIDDYTESKEAELAKAYLKQTEK